MKMKKKHKEPAEGVVDEGMVVDEDEGSESSCDEDGNWSILT